MSVYGNKINSEVKINIMKRILLSLFLITFFPAVVEAVPFLYNPLPVNNSFFSSGEISFDINITEGDLNSSSVTLHLISLDAYIQNESWENYTMDCTNYAASSWNCSKQLSFPVVGSDTLELFYFDAKDNSGNIGMNNTDNAITSLRFTLDRKPPYINFLNPTNGTWVSGVETIKIDVVDASSGVNDSAVNYSFDRVDWLNTTKCISSYYDAAWNTSGLTNNQTITIYAKATDNVNNTNETNVNVTVDNEIPSLEILSPFQNQILNSTVQFRINVSDIYSGIIIDSALFSIAGISEFMDCSGSINYTCTKLFDTFRVSDGGYTMNFSIADNAGNVNTSSIPVTVTNKKALITISEPVNNSYVNNITLFRASLSDPTNVDHVKLVTSSEEKNMSCTTDFSGCSVDLDTAQYQDGKHNIIAKVIATTGEVLTNSSITLIFDNTRPQLVVKYPVGEVKGNFNINANVSDEFPDENKVIFYVGRFAENMICTKHSGKKLICEITFVSSLLQDGSYDVVVSAEDLAGNSVLSRIKITVADNTTTFEKIGIDTVETNETTTGAGKNIIQTITQTASNLNVYLPIGIGTLLIIVAVFLVRKFRKKHPEQEKPWYETIGTETGEE